MLKWLDSDLEYNLQYDDDDNFKPIIQDPKKVDGAFTINIRTFYYFFCVLWTFYTYQKFGYRN